MLRKSHATPPLLTSNTRTTQYGPNIAHYILTHAPFNSTLNLKGIAAGNACWGGDATSVECNGPNSERNDLDMYYGKGLVSKKLYEAAYAACYDPPAADGPTKACAALIREAFDSIGPHNVYFLYDTCSLDELTAWLTRVGKTYRWLLTALRTELSSNGMVSPLKELLDAQPAGTSNLRYPGADGGFIYGCGGEKAIRSWLHSPPVQKALHLRSSGSAFGYDRGGPASITLWPFLSKHLRVLICARTLALPRPPPPLPSRAPPLPFPRPTLAKRLRSRAPVGPLSLAQTMATRTRACRTRATRSGSTASRRRAPSPNVTRGGRGFRRVPRAHVHPPAT